METGYDNRGWMKGFFLISNINLLDTLLNLTTN
ncbi:MAG: hypothetical protein UR68_C0006G0001, partial [Candidatus Roizmanbacteria bacterium GW2011_GWA2_35_19]